MRDSGPAACSAGYFPTSVNDGSRRPGRPAGAPAEVVKGATLPHCHWHWQAVSLTVSPVWAAVTGKAVTGTGRPGPGVWRSDRDRALPGGRRGPGAPARPTGPRGSGRLGWTGAGLGGQQVRRALGAGGAIVCRTLAAAGRHSHRDFDMARPAAGLQKNADHAARQRQERRLCTKEVIHGHLLA
jgi:hypothetical protein